MLLKRLEIMGFKSFADKVAIEFGAGVSAVVGPNGSGKSNLTEAVRWVLGEGSVRSLRGQRMEDVIFGGSPTRRPLPLAEVSITFDNSDATLPLAFAEVTVTRRVDRSGSSEYFINRVEARLRDVHELLAGTGLSGNAYAIVGQGQVEEILAARPAERRAMVEEASGITRFRLRLQQAARRLATVESGRQRLEDIAHERAVRVETLRGEATRAARYAAMRRELRELELGSWAMEAQEIGERRRAAEAAIAMGEQLLQDAATRLSEIAVRQRALGAELSDVRTRRASASTRRQQWQQKWQQAEQAAALADGLERAAREEAERAAQRLHVIEERVGRLDEQGQQLEQQLRDRAEEVEMRRVESVAARGRWEEAQRRLRALTEERARCESQRAVVRERWTTALADRAAMQAVITAVEELEGRGREARRVAMESQAALDRLCLAVAEAEEQLAVLRDEIRSLRAHRDLLRQWRSSLESRMQTLAELQSQAVGFAQGPRTVLMGKAKGVLAYRGVVGALGDLLTVPDSLMAAVAAALGASVQDLVATSARAAQEAIEALQASRGGRATFLPLDALVVRPPDRAAQDALRAEEGALGWAVDLVEFSEEIARAVHYALGRVVVARDLTSARQIGRRLEFRLRIVTVAGEVIHVGGAMSGGATRDEGNRGAMLGRDGQRRRLALRVRAVSADVEQLDGILERLGQSEGALSLHLEEEKKRRVAQERACATADAVLAGLEAEGQRLEGQRQAAVGRGGEGSLSVAEWAAEGERLEREIAALAPTLMAAEEEERTARDADTQAQVALASAQKTHQGLVELLRERQSAEASLQGQVRAVQAERDEAQGRAAEQAVRARTSRVEAAASQVAMAQEEAEEQSLRQQEDVLVQRLEGEASAREGVESERDAMVRTLRRAEADLARAEAAQAALAARLDEAYGLPLDALREIAPYAASPEVTQRMVVLREELRATGGVRPESIGEYEAERRSYEALVTEIADVQGAIAGLQEWMAEVEAELGTRYLATLERVQEAFAATYARLSGGGAAALEPVDEDRGPTEISAHPGSVRPVGGLGLEVVVRPPGKKPAHLSLLSGGERTLAAIALLFALVQVQPAAFCILDEIEAALDESNVVRCASFLREIGANGQFIMVTHQKASMEAADRLIGVTMRDGVSSLVSIRLAG